MPGLVNYKAGCTRFAAESDKDYQLLAHGRWFSPGTLASSTTTTGRHDIAEILLKMALSTNNQSINHIVSEGCSTICGFFRTTSYQLHTSYSNFTCCVLLFS
jgi:hypothetical protein